jgi:signal transduction histidine kinase
MPMTPASPLQARLERLWPVASLRAYLVMTVLVALAPVSVFLACQIAREVRIQREDTAAMLRQNATSKARMFSREVDASVDALRGLARTESLARGDTQEFARAQRLAPPLRRHWHSLLLLDAAGRPVFDTARAGSEGEVPPSAARQRCARARSGEPVVTDLSEDPASPRPFTLVCVSVPVAGEGTHVLAARIDGGAWQALAEDASLPAGASATLFDGGGRVIASTAEPRLPIGAPFGPGAGGRVERTSRAGAGAGPPPADAYAIWLPVPSTGWGVAIEVPAAPIDRARRDLVIAALSTTGACLLLGILAALLLARHVTGPLHRMALPALLRSSRRVAIREIAELRDALAQAQQAHQAAQRREAEVRAELEAAARAKDEFLSTISHELRTPLGALLSASELLQASDGDAELQSEARSVIARQTLNMARLIGDMLDMAQVVSGQIALHRQPVSLPALVAGVHADLRDGDALRGHRVRLELREAWIDADEGRVRQALSTLLLAVLNSRAAGGRIEIRTGPADPAMARLEIADIGDGAASTVLPQVFERFVQGHRLLDHRAGALGLRLALISRLVELHGGQLDMRRKALATCFVMRLPLIQATAGAGPAEPSASSSGGDAPGALSAPPGAHPSGVDAPGRRTYRAAASRCKRVLVMHRDAAEAARVCVALESVGHAARPLRAGPVGLEHLRDQDPQVVLMGSDLPGLTREQGSRQARAAGFAGRMVAFDLPEDPAVADAMRAAGFDDCLQARASIDALCRTVEQD